MTLVLIALFVATVATGPAGREWLEHRAQRADFPKVRVTYLPSGACRGAD